MRRRTALLGLTLASVLSFTFVSPVIAGELVSSDEAVSTTYVTAGSEGSLDELIVIDSGILTADRYAPE